MYVINARNVNDALYQGLQYLATHGIKEDSRNGPVLVAPGPVTTVYTHPWERVLICPERDANPFFHLMEAIWMLAGRRDVAFVQQFNSRIGKYSDDAVNLHGAYGYRWRTWFGYDQLSAVAEELRRDPNTRRAVLTMWDAGEHNYPEMSDAACNGDSRLEPTGDPAIAKQGGKDVPCNTHIYFDVRGGKLNMTVCCRSNDIWWGAYGANAVHFSVLQELMAVWCGVQMGVYRQISNNYHLYTAVVSDLATTIDDAGLGTDAAMSYYDNEWENVDMTGWIVQPTLETIAGPLDGKADGPEAATTFLQECEDFCIAPLEDRNYRHEFFPNTLRPMYEAYTIRKTKLGILPESNGLSIASRIQAPDWQYTCMEWIARRELKKETK